VSLVQTIKLELVAAQKARLAVKVETLKMLNAAWQNKQIAARKTAADATKELTDTEALAVLRTEIKKRQEAIEAYTAGGRPELATKEQQELEILQQYLPPQLTIEQVQQIVLDKIKQTGAAGAKDFGLVMPLVIAEVAGAAEGSLVSKLVKEALG